MNESAANPSVDGGKAPDATLIAVILDRSGSMGTVRDATIKGFNEFLHTQQKQTDGGSALMSLTQFDNRYEVNFVGEPIVNVPDLDNESYVPRGNTALYDAIGRTVHEVDAWTKDRQWQDRVLMLIVTDGQENASQEYDLATVRALIEQKEKEGWNFAYMGANQDSYAVGGAMNIQPGFIANFDCTPDGASANFRRMARSSSSYRSARSRGAAATFFDPTVRQAADPTRGSGQVKPNPGGNKRSTPKRGIFQWLKNLFTDRADAA